MESKKITVKVKLILADHLTFDESLISQIELSALTPKLSI